MQIKPELTDEYAAYTAINQGDGYSARVVSYSEDWAALMEPRIAAGESIADIAQETSRAADTDRITGFMYDCAVTGLTKFWVHGDELLKWHNRKYIKDQADADQKSAEGKQVSTSMFTIGG